MGKDCLGGSQMLMLGFLLRGHYRQINELFVGHMDAIPEPHVQLGADSRTLL